MAVFLKEISEYLLQNGVLNFAFQLEEITVFYFFFMHVWILNIFLVNSFQ